MPNNYYNASGNPVTLNRGASSIIRAEYSAVVAGFALLPTIVQNFSSSSNYAVDSGAVNAYQITVNAAIVSLAVDGYSFRFKTANANTGASTLNSISIVRQDGSPLEVGDIVNGPNEVIYNSTTSKFHLFSMSSVASSASAAASAAAAAASAAAALVSKNAASTSAGASATSAAAALVSENNAAASAVIASNYASALTSTSTTSLLIATGSKVFTTQANKGYAAGQFFSAISAANSANFMHGTVGSYVGTTLTTTVTDIGGSGTLADWNLSVSGSQGSQGSNGISGGATQTTSGVDIALTSASTIVQEIAMTTSGLKVTLPNATTFLSSNKGASTFTITNSGLYSLRVVDFGGNTKAILGSGQSITLDLVDIATSTGYWIAHNVCFDRSTLGCFYVGAQTAVSAQAVNNSDGRIAICSLSADKFLLAYSDSTAGLGRVLVVDLTATVPTYGTALTFLGSATPTFLSITTISSTQAILCYMNGSTSEAKTINVSGSTCTAGAAHDYAGAAVNYNNVTKASATTAMVTYNTTANNYSVKLLTVTGTAIGSGTAGAIRSGVATSSRASTTLSATRGGILYVLDSTIADLRSATIDLSVNPPTVSGDAILISTTPSLTTLTGLPENNNAIATYLTGSTVKAVPLNYAASSVAQGTHTTILTDSTSSTAVSLINGRSIGCTINAASSVRFVKVLVENGSTINNNSQVKFTEPEFITFSNLGAYFTNAISTSGKALYGFRNSSTTFANTVTQEIVG